MTVLAILVTLAALAWTAKVIFANGPRSCPGIYDGRLSILAAWILAALVWLACWVR